MGHSYLLGGATAGMHVRVAAPDGYQPDPAIVAQAQEIAARTGGSAAVLDDAALAANGADVIATDPGSRWAMTDAPRHGSAAPVQINDDPCAGRTGRDRAALPARLSRRGDHCGGARRPGQCRLGRGGARLHAQKALLAWLLERSTHSLGVPSAA